MNAKPLHICLFCPVIKASPTRYIILQKTEQPLDEFIGHEKEPYCAILPSTTAKIREQRGDDFYMIMGFLHQTGYFTTFCIFIKT